MKEMDGILKVLSAKEREVMRCFASGMTALSTAAELGVSPHTVDTYLRQIRSPFPRRCRGDLCPVKSSLDSRRVA